MNIAIFADVHGRLLLCFKLCERWERETGEKLDLVLQAGDLGVFPDISKLDKATIRHAQEDPSELGFATDFAAYNSDIATLLAQTAFPLIFVRGNHEDHEWLDSLEKRSDQPLFPIDTYNRIFCLKTGIPYTFTVNNESICILGIGRIAAPVGEKQGKSKYIQPAELERLYDLGKVQPDVLLTHDTALDAVTKGLGMEEIRLILDAYNPSYHFHGHTEEPFTQRLDKNGETIVYKMADLHWAKANYGKPLEPGVMGILRWENRKEHAFEVVDAPWLNEYSAKTWRLIN